MSKKLDFTQVAFQTVLKATHQGPIVEKDEPLPPKAVAGRKGGIVGGAARAASLTPERRSEIAREAAAKRWGKKPA